MAQDSNPPGPLTDNNTQTAASILDKLNEEEPADDEKLVLDTTDDGKETDKEEEKEEDKPEGEETDTDKEDDKESEDDDDVEEVDEEIKLELAPTRKEILKKYPNLFKDFPHLQTAMYRNRELSELFPTVEDAREAADKVQTLDKFENLLLSGDTTEVLKAVKGQDENAFNKIVNNYLPTLLKVDQGAYWHVLRNVVSHTVISMANEGQKLKNSALTEAAEILNQFIFGRSEFVPPSDLEVKEKDDTVDQERQQFLNERFETSRDDINARVDNILKTAINDSIDPKKQMTDYVKRTAVRESLEKVHEVIKNDSMFKRTLDKLWTDSRDKKFDKESTDRIKRAYINKAKTILPQIINKSRNEALKGLGKKVRDEEVDRRGPIAVGKTSTSQNSRQSGKQSGGFKPGMSTLDYLTSD